MTNGSLGERFADRQSVRLSVYAIVATWWPSNSAHHSVQSEPEAETGSSARLNVVAAVLGEQGRKAEWASIAIGIVRKNSRASSEGLVRSHL
jgi:hypothetical protein